MRYGSLVLWARAIFVAGFAALGIQQVSAINEIEMLVPGFTVEEVPVELPNVNNLRFAPDGSLTALGYNGKVWSLRDSDSDGMEDEVRTWWDKAPFTVPVGMFWSTHGLYVSSSGKVSRLSDSDGDGIADREDVVASGWPDKDAASGNVDATGVTMDAEGNLYFGLLTANYANAYRVKRVGELSAEERSWLESRGTMIPSDPSEEVSLYDLDGMRGSVQRLDARSGTRETFATGVRVPYQFAFNRAGDLFMTDQEGETWCAVGNPLDEFNHIVRGGNYGFPPRDERWLPDLVSIEPVVGFGPQHQSTCGFVFNEPHDRLGISQTERALPAAPGQGLFGPAHWEGNSIVTGESRGKLWRVRLEKGGGRYLGKPFMIARLSMLTTDVAISPSGDLYVSCHSGPPDWGTGPEGIGKIFRIRYTDREAPQVLDVESVGNDLVRVSFDRPISTSVIEANKDLIIESGLHVRSADRYEQLKPPYEAVATQEAEPRMKQRVRSMTLLYESRVLEFETEPVEAGHFRAFTLAGVQATQAGATAHEFDLEVRPDRDAMSGYAAPTLSSKPRGDYEDGKHLFFSDRLMCATCHHIRGEGGGRGPDLSNLVSRDLASVIRDITDPAASINPDYVGHEVRLENGESVVGLIRRLEGGGVRVSAVTGEEREFAASDFSEIVPIPGSLMPAGLIDGLSESERTDLLTFLMNQPPKRTRKDIANFATSILVSDDNSRSVSVVLVASDQDHGDGQHDYPAWQRSWHGLLSGDDRVQVEDAWLWPTEDHFRDADALVFYYWNRAWDERKYEQLDAFQARGGGIVVLHSATIEDRAPEELARRIGLAAQPQTVLYRHMPFDLRIIYTGHPITSGLPRTLPFLDEPYWPMIGDRSAIRILANAVDIDGEDRPMMWTFERGPGRVFACIAGHYTWTLDDPWFRLIVLRGLDWVTRSDHFERILVGRGD